MAAAAPDVCGATTGRVDTTGPIDCPNLLPCPDHPVRIGPPASSYAASRNGPIAHDLDGGGWAEDRGFPRGR
jgi:hypothetical protein